MLTLRGSSKSLRLVGSCILSCCTSSPAYSGQHHLTECWCSMGLSEHCLLFLNDLHWFYLNASVFLPAPELRTRLSMVCTTGWVLGADCRLLCLWETFWGGAIGSFPFSSSANSLWKTNSLSYQFAQKAIVNHVIVKLCHFQAVPPALCSSVQIHPLTAGSLCIHGCFWTCLWFSHAFHMTP